MQPVQQSDFVDFLGTFDAGTVDHILTSPPYIGLPGRDDTRKLVAKLLSAAGRILTADGTATLIVGSTRGNTLLPYELASSVAEYSRGNLDLHSLYIWNRSGTLARDTGQQIITHDVILHITRNDPYTRRALSTESVIKTSQHGFNYGTGVTTPPDLAAFLVDAVSAPGELIVDPLAGLAEIGVQALVQGRRFAGCDKSPECVAIANARLAEHVARAVHA